MGVPGDNDIVRDDGDLVLGTFFGVLQYLDIIIHQQGFEFGIRQVRIGLPVPLVRIIPPDFYDPDFCQERICEPGIRDLKEVGLS